MGKILATMDMWSDPKLAPFMTVMAHWIQAIWEETVGAKRLVLKLRADLISFQHVLGCHDGEHMAVAFLYITDCIKITGKVCCIQISVAQFKSWKWFYIIRLAGLCLIMLQTTTHLWLTFNIFLVATVFSFITSSIEFGTINVLAWTYYFSDFLPSCFLHIVNLACKALLAAVTDLKYATTNAADHPSDNSTTHLTAFADIIKHQDPIAMARWLICTVSQSISWCTFTNSVADMVIFSPPPVLLQSHRCSEAEELVAATWHWHVMVFNIFHDTVSVDFKGG